MRILYLTHVCISVFMLISHNPLYSAEHKEEKTEATTEGKIGYDHVGKYIACRTQGYWPLKTLQKSVQQYLEQTRYNALKAALRSRHNDAIQFYAQKLNLWPLYIEALQAGEIENVQTLLPLMVTQYTIPEYHNQEKKYRTLPIDDCSGLVKVIEAKSLDDGQKIALMNIIIKFYKPKKYRCDSTCCIRCSFACNQRRAALVVYGLAKAGEACIESQSSYALFKYIYGVQKALLTTDAFDALTKQGKLLEASELAKKHRSKHTNLLVKFGSVHLPDEAFSNGYYNEIALPVITNNNSRSWWTTQLCSKE